MREKRGENGSLESGKMKADSISVWHTSEMKAEEMHAATNEARPK